MSEMRATEATRRLLEAVRSDLPMADEQDFQDAARGFVAASPIRQIRDASDRMVWDLDAYDFTGDDSPSTVNPSLWRQAQLLSRDGLFEVVPGIYQVRGYDLSVMTIIEGREGVIVVDPLLTKEPAAAAFALYTEVRGDRPVHAMVYTHSHLDHFGGVKGVITEDDVVSGRTQVIAPEGFMRYAVSENVFAGTAMSRRAAYMYGAALDKGPTGQVSTGLGQTISAGEPTLIPPTVTISSTGQELTVDGVRLIFQVTPHTEAPAEMNFYLPDHRALCTAENTSHNMHNILTIRGAEVRDAHAWASYLGETIALWGDELDVVFASHHWPTWGRARAVEFLSLQRDMYAYIHGQTLRLMNAGYVGSEIAEMITMPPALEAAWHTRGYYGSVSHNVKAIYQRYMGWYDGNPSHLWSHPPVAAAERYVAALGGPDGAFAHAQRAFDQGDYRWAAELLNHLLFNDETHAPSRALQAAVYEQLGFGSENGTWRNAFLSGAQELRQGTFGTPTSSGAPDIVGALTVEQLFDSVGVRIDGPKAWNEDLVMSWRVTDESIIYVVEVHNGALTQHLAAVPAPGSTVFTLTRRSLIGLMTGAVDLLTATTDGTITVEGDPFVLATLFGFLVPGDPNFPIVTP